jgi:acyl-CoA reductase-like NAD-dependent aldehyde dehydrogenase
VLGVCEQRLREIEQLRDALVRDAVVDDAMLAPRLHKTAPAQAGEMIRDLRLRLPEARDELADRQLTLVAQQLEDAHPGRVAEAAEVLRDEVAVSRSFGQATVLRERSSNRPGVISDVRDVITVGEIV